MEEVVEAAPEAEVVPEEAVAPVSKLQRHHLKDVTIVLIMTGKDDTTPAIQVVQALERKVVGI